MHRSDGAYYLSTWVPYYFYEEDQHVKPYQKPYIYHMAGVAPGLTKALATL